LLAADAPLPFSGRCFDMITSSRSACATSPRFCWVAELLICPAPARGVRVQPAFLGALPQFTWVPDAPTA
jgi:hypothetical protein